jgi:phage terminase small subunit
MPQRITSTELTGLKAQYANFVIEYVKDCSARRAAEASGYEPDYGATLLKRPEIKAVIDVVLAKRLEATHIDAEWVLMEAADNHQIARQMGNITASNTALNLVAKHTFVDAFAAEKVEVNSDKEVMDRLLRGRRRMAGIDADEQPADEEVSFF